MNARSLQFDYAKGLHEASLVLVLLYDSETVVWREKEMPRIRAVQMDNLRVLLDIRRMYRVANARIREICGVMKGWVKGLMKVFSDGSTLLRELKMIVLLKDCVGSSLVGRLWNKCIIGINGGGLCEGILVAWPEG